MKDEHMTAERVAALVLNFNQKEFLPEMLKALVNQTRKVDTIFIIDNHSTDKTPEFLFEQGVLPQTADENNTEPIEIKTVYKNTELIYHRTTENYGCAGGNYVAFQRAHKDNYDYYWVFDSDGLPETDCLEKLLAHKNKADYISPLILNRNNPKETCFGLKENIADYFTKVFNDPEKIKSHSQNGLMPNTANPWSGALIKKAVLDKIGYPRKEFFITADEVEYAIRTMQNGFNILTVTDAVCYHPKPVQTKLRKTQNFLRTYCSARNYFILHWEYFNPFVLGLHTSKKLFKTILTGNLKALEILFTGWFDAITGRWGREKEYLK